MYNSDMSEVRSESGKTFTGGEEIPLDERGVLSTKLFDTMTIQVEEGTGAFTHTTVLHLTRPQVWNLYAALKKRIEGE
jgi:hypothetical protein